MSSVGSMQHLVSEIANSNIKRQKAICDIKEFVKKNLKSINVVRHKNAVKLIKTLKKNQIQIHENVFTFLNNLNETRKKTMISQRHSLAQTRMNLREHVKKFLLDAGSCRKESSACIRHDLEQLGNERRTNLREALAADHDCRTEAAFALRQELAKGSTARQEEIKALRHETAKLLATIRASLKESFSATREERQSDIRKIRESVSLLRSEFVGEMASLRTNIQDAAVVWQASCKGGVISPEMTDLRENSSVGISSELSVAAPLSKEDELSPIAPSQTEEAPLSMEIAEEQHPVEAELPFAGDDLKDRIMAMVNTRKGVSLTEVAESFGVATVVLGRVARDLLDEGKVRRHGKLYFSTQEFGQSS